MQRIKQKKLIVIFIFGLGSTQLRLRDIKEESVYVIFADMEESFSLPRNPLGCVHLMNQSTVNHKRNPTGTLTSLVQSGK